MQKNRVFKKLNIIKNIVVILFIVLISNIYATNIGLNRPNDNIADNIYPGYNPYAGSSIIEKQNIYEYKRDFTPYIINRVVDHQDVDHKFANYNEDIFEFKNRDAYFTFNVGSYNKITFTISGDGYSRQGYFDMIVNNANSIIEKYTHTVNDVAEHSIYCNQYDNITIKLTNIVAPVEWKRRVYVHGIRLGY